jgi:hypothetical protein
MKAVTSNPKTIQKNKKFLCLNLVLRKLPPTADKIRNPRNTKYPTNTTSVLFETLEKILLKATKNTRNQARVLEERRITAKSLLEGILKPPVKKPRFKRLSHIFKSKKLHINI